MLRAATCASFSTGPFLRWRGFSDQAARVSFTVVDAKGGKHAVSGAVGKSVLDAARAAGVDVIEGPCSGGLACGLCRTAVSAEHMAKAPKPSDAEKELLSFVSPNPDKERLACQVFLQADMEGMTVTVPPKADEEPQQK